MAKRSESEAAPSKTLMKNSIMASVPCLNEKSAPERRTLHLISSRSLSRNGFSLIELLVVIAVLALALALSAPALLNVAKGQGMKRAIGEVSELAELARAEAMASSTWIWMGLREQTSSGQRELVAVLVASKDGTTNMAPSNLRIIQNPVRVENVKILPALTQWASVSGTVPLVNTSFRFSQTIRGQSLTFSNTVLGFSPRGEATTGNGAVPPWIEIGLREMRGEVEIPDKTASIKISGFSGQQSVDY